MCWCSAGGWVSIRVHHHLFCFSLRYFIMGVVQRSLHGHSFHLYLLQLALQQSIFSQAHHSIFCCRYAFVALPDPAGIAGDRFYIFCALPGSQFYIQCLVAGIAGCHFVDRAFCIGARSHLLYLNSQVPRSWQYCSPGHQVVYVCNSCDLSGIAGTSRYPLVCASQSTIRFVQKYSGMPCWDREYSRCGNYFTVPYSSSLFSL